MNQKPTLLLLPTLNEQEALERLIKEVPKEFDVLVVDSFSADKTVEVARGAGFTVIEAKHGIGQASGIRTGMEYFLGSGYEALVAADCDYSDDPKGLPAVVSRLGAGDYDIVLGVRDFGKQRKYLGAFTIAVKLTVRLMIKLILGLDVTDVLTGVWAFNRRAVEKLHPLLRERKFGHTFEMLYHAWALGLRIGEADIDFRPRLGKTKFTYPLRALQVYYGLKYGLKAVYLRLMR